MRRRSGTRATAACAAAGCCGLLAACTVGPNYRVPAPALPPAYAGAGPAPLRAGAAARSPTAQASGSGGGAAPSAVIGAWWRGFHDPELASLVTRALRGNLDLKSALSRVREARDEEIMAGAARLPRLDADASANRTRISENSGITQFEQFFGGGGAGSGGSSSSSGSGSGSSSGSAGAGGSQSGQGAGGFAIPGNVIAAYSVGLDASWETDLFGGVRRRIEAASAEAERAVWSARDSEVMVAAQVAGDYLTLRVLQREMAIDREEIAREKRTLALIRARRRFGFVTSLDVSEQQALLAASQATVPDLDAEIRAAIHGLGALLGENPEALRAELVTFKALPERPPAVPIGLPSQLLRRRPDIRAAERELAASSARIGIAVSALYPQFSLTGALDFVSLDLTHLLDLSSRQSSVTGAISWPIFAGRQIEANIRIAEESDRRALYAYQKTVIGALKDVEDALVRYRDDRQKNAALRRELSAARAAETVALAQYKAGLVNLTPVLSTQGSVLSARDALAQSDGALDRDVVALYEALGGGWESGAARP